MLTVMNRKASHARDVSLETGKLSMKDALGIDDVTLNQLYFNKTITLQIYAALSLFTINMITRIKIRDIDGNNFDLFNMIQR